MHLNTKPLTTEPPSNSFNILGPWTGVTWFIDWTSLKYRLNIITRFVLIIFTGVMEFAYFIPLKRRHNKSHGISNHRYLDCLFNACFRLTWKNIKANGYRGIHRSPVDSPQKGPVTSNVFLYHNVIKHFCFSPQQFHKGSNPQRCDVKATDTKQNKA